MTRPQLQRCSTKRALFNTIEATFKPILSNFELQIWTRSWKAVWACDGRWPANSTKDLLRANAAGIDEVLSR